jgi:hypothetical protein
MSFSRLSFIQWLLRASDDCADKDIIKSGLYCQIFKGAKPADLPVLQSTKSSSPSTFKQRERRRECKQDRKHLLLPDPDSRRISCSEKAQTLVRPIAPIGHSIFWRVVVASD